MEQYNPIVVDLSMVYGLLNAVVKITGLTGLCAVRPNIKKDELKSVEIILEIKNHLQIDSVVLDKLDFHTLISAAPGFSLLSGGETVSGTTSVLTESRTEVLRYTLFPVLVNASPVLFLMTFYQEKELSPDETGFILSVLNVIRHILVLQHKIDSGLSAGSSQPGS